MAGFLLSHIAVANRTGRLSPGKSASRPCHKCTTQSLIRSMARKRGVNMIATRTNAMSAKAPLFGCNLEILESLDVLERQ